jgi:transcriptional regulator with XRE-family HTH domain
MAQGRFDTEGFCAALDAERRTRKLTWKLVAGESGVSASTLTRMAQGRRPDLEGLAKLCAWSGLSADDFIRTGATSTEPGTLAKITSYLRADPHLDAQSAEMIEHLIKTTYERFRKKQG